MKNRLHAFRIAIVGGGKSGAAFLETLHKDPSIEITGIADINPKAPGITLARRLKIPVARDHRRLIRTRRADLIVDLTGKSEVWKGLKELNSGVELIGGTSARLLRELVATRLQSRQEVESQLHEYRTLYDLALKLMASESLDRVYRTTVEYVTRLIGTPAGSLAVLDEKRGEMQLGFSKGFSRNITTKARWKLRQGGLTGTILNQEDPVVIEDTALYPRFDKRLLLKEGVRSLVAAPLKAEGKIIGILFVDDLKPRRFTRREVSLVSLIATISATAVDKTRTLENSRLLAITDELTGLFNHRHFRQEFASELSRSQRYRRPLSLMMIDIDYFKNYNDRHGHLRGNEVLKELGQILKGMTREVDIVARYGGEEFSIILAETNRKKARKMAERLCRKIEGHPFEGRQTQPDRKITVSIGVASFPQDAETTVELIEKADRALYAAKRLGRNRVSVSRG